jgi:hypothetical protein
MSTINNDGIELESKNLPESSTTGDDDSDDIEAELSRLEESAISSDDEEDAEQQK